MPDLIEPTATLHTAWIEARDEWGPGLHEDGFGLLASDETDSAEGFAAWLARLAEDTDPARTLAVGRHRGFCRWIVEDGRVLGGIAFRYGPGEFVAKYGHFGYGVRPSARRRGLASWALRRMIEMARDQDAGPLLLTCMDDNIASGRTIESVGGILEEIRDEGHDVGVRRYRLAAP